MEDDLKKKREKKDDLIFFVEKLEDDFALQTYFDPTK